jgi:hypothetical protein
MKLRKTGLFGAVMLAAVMVAGSANAQLRDVTQTPNAINAGIRKSFTQQIGAGRGDIFTPGSSAFIIARDPARAIRRGRQIFQRKFQVGQGFGPTTGDGVGNVAVDASVSAGLVDSCAGCHGRPRGSAGHGGDVVTRPDSRDAPHLFGLGLQEQLGDEITSALRAIRTDARSNAQSSGASVTRPLLAKGINYGAITANPDGTFDTSGVVGVDPDLRVRPFFAQGGTISIREFLVGAFNAEMGLEAPDTDTLQAAGGGSVQTPSGMVLNGRLDKIERPPVSSPTQDSDGDGKVNEIPVSIVDFMEFYLLNYFKPATGNQSPNANDPANDASDVLAGRAVFTQLQCGTCHIPTLTINSDRRVADVETVYDPVNGNPFNRLFSTASLRLTAFDDGSGFPSLKSPTGDSFVVNNFFADLKRHDLGPNFREQNYDGTFQQLFITEPLWGVGTTAPYGHDGRSVSLEEVILRHGCPDGTLSCSSEAAASAAAFAALPRTLKTLLFSFLQSLQLFPPDDTASNLQVKNTADPNYPQRGHGAIALTVLFNDPTEIE